MDDFDVDFRVEDGESVMCDRLVNDALNHNLVHLSKYDIEGCFEDLSPSYFEAKELSELVDYAKGKKIKAMLLFVSEETQMSDVKEAIDAIKPYCTADCVDGSKILFGAGDDRANDNVKYRTLIAYEIPKSESEFGEDIQF